MDLCAPSALVTVRKTIFLLALSQALAISVNSMLLTSAALVGADLALSEQWATIPLSLMFLSTMFSTLPASLMMQRKGRRWGFMLATWVMLLSGAIAAMSIYWLSFFWFSFSLLGLGFSFGFYQFFRFAAIDVVPPSHAAKAVGWVLAGGLIAAFLGPSIVAKTHVLDLQHPFFITYLVAIPLSILLLVILWQMDFSMPVETESSGKSRTVMQIVRQPVFVVAMSCAAVAYGIMTLIMTATPMAMIGHGFVIGQTAFVIQWHLVGMFAPSFFTGALIERFGVLNIILVGIIVYFVVIGLNLLQHTMLLFWIALLLLGLGWNLLYIGGTSLLQDAWLEGEKGRVQGINDTLVFTLSSISALMAGWLYVQAGWAMMNLLTLPLIVFVLLAVVLLQYNRRKLLVQGF